MVKRILLIILTYAVCGHAESLPFELGHGIHVGATSPVTQQRTHAKLMALDAYVTLNDWLKVKSTVGSLVRTNYFVLGDQVPYFATQLAAYVSNDTFYAEICQGIAFFRDPFPSHGTDIHFPTSIFVAINGGRTKIGIEYIHFSNGSGKANNVGLDFLGIKISRRL